MGVCHDEAIMNMGQILKTVNTELNVNNMVTYSGTKSDERKRDVFFLYPLEGDIELLSSMEDGELKDVYPHSYKRSGTNAPPGLPFPYDTGIIKVRTVNNLIGKIKNEGPIGSYLIAVRDHVLAVHKLNDGTAYIVDTEGKFRPKSIIRQLIYLDRNPEKELFEWMENNPKQTKKIVHKV